jgi:hypothetical protein
MKKSFVFLTLCIMLSVFVMSCASYNTTYRFRPGVHLSQVNGNSVKVGQAESKVVLGIFGDRTFPTVKQAADNGRITKIATVEYYAKSGVLGLWTDYYTIVTGE